MMPVRNQSAKIQGVHVFIWSRYKIKYGKQFGLIAVFR